MEKRLFKVTDESNYFDGVERMKKLTTTQNKWVSI